MKLNNEEKVMLRILKDYLIDYNSNSLAKVIGVTPMGALKILRRLEDQKLIVKKKISNINFYNINFDSSYARDYSSLLLKKESESSSAFVKRWINELRKVRSVEMGILFGSVLIMEKKARDIDVLFVVDKIKLPEIKKEISKLNSISDKNVHPVYQTKGDLVQNLKEKDKVVSEIVKGKVIFGEKKFIEILSKLK